VLRESGANGLLLRPRPSIHPSGSAHRVSSSPSNSELLRRGRLNRVRGSFGSARRPVRSIPLPVHRPVLVDLPHSEDLKKRGNLRLVSDDKETQTHSFQGLRHLTVVGPVAELQGVDGAEQVLIFLRAAGQKSSRVDSCIPLLPVDLVPFTLRCPRKIAIGEFDEPGNGGSLSSLSDSDRKN
jgi:hypothetical protein